MYLFLVMLIELNTLIANIESREWRRQYIVAKKLLPEHLRASMSSVF